MYEPFWGLSCKPFDSRFSSEMVYEAKSLIAAESKMRYVIESRLPAAIVTGGPGVGKTVLLRMLEERYRGNVAFHHVPFAQLPPTQLLACIASRIGGAPVEAGQGETESLRLIEEQLVQFATEGRQICLVIDECHTMSGESFETLRLVMNLIEPTGAELTMLLAGQPAVRNSLQYQPQVEERFAVRLNLPRLDAEETAGYIGHRTAAAGATRPIFTEDAVMGIHQATSGVPGRINRLCDMALLVGFADDLSVIDLEQIRQVDKGLFTMPWAA